MGLDISVSKIIKTKDLNNCIELIYSSFELKHLSISKYSSHGIKNVLNLEIKNPFSPYDFIMAKYNDEIVAFAELKTVFQRVNLNMIAVDKYYKGNNIGKIFLDKIIELKKTEGCTSFHLDVFKSNSPALKLYDKFNFSEKSVSLFGRVKVDNNKNSQSQFNIVNYPQFYSEKKQSGYAFLRILFNDKFIEFTCINDNLLLLSNKSDYISIGCELVLRLKLKNLYFVCADNEEIVYDYELLERILSLEMSL